MNRVLEEMLRHYVRPDHADWDKHLEAAEFAVNNSWQESIRNTPFFLNYGRHPRPPTLTDLSGHMGEGPTAREQAQDLQERVQQAKKYLRASQERSRQRVNAKRREVHFAEGDQVLLSTENLSSTRMGGATVRKLMPRFMGPFPVAECIGAVNVRLALPKAWTRVHPVFHVSLVKPYVAPGSARANAREHVAGDPPPPVQWLEGEPVYEVERILAHRESQVRGRKKNAAKKPVGKKTTSLQFLVRWRGCGPEYDTWEPQSGMHGCAKELRRYKASVGLPLLPEEQGGARYDPAQTAELVRRLTGAEEHAASGPTL
jgi:hypothetical protein